MPLDVQVYPPVNGNQYLTLEGRLDSHSHEMLDRQLVPLLAQKPQALVLDLARLEYISSAGIRSILQARKALAPYHGKLLVLHPQEQIRKVMELAQAVPLEAIFTSTEQADAYLDALQRQILEGDPQA